MYAEECTDSMRTAIEDSNRRRYKQIQFNLENEILPTMAKRSGSGSTMKLSSAEEAKYDQTNDYIMRMAADIEKSYTARNNDLDALIALAKEKMEEAAKSLDFLAAAQYRDRMYELQRLKEEQKRG